METDRFVEFHQALYSIKTRETFKDMFEFFFWELSWKDTEVHNRRMAVSREYLLPSAGSCWDHLHLVGGKLKPLLNTSYEAFKRGWRQYVKGKGKQGCNELNWGEKASVLWTTSTLFLQHSSCFSLFSVRQQIMQTACQSALTTHQAMPHVGASQQTELAEVHTKTSQIHPVYGWLLIFYVAQAMTWLKITLIYSTK